VELATTRGSSSSAGLNSAAISVVFTISYVANRQPARRGRKSALRFFDLAGDMFPEDGVGEGGVPAFMRDGIELQKIIADKRAAARAPPQVKPAE
jgi:hypothetical protein